MIPIAFGVLGKCAGVSCGMGLSATKAAAIGGAALVTPEAVRAASSSKTQNSNCNQIKRSKTLNVLLESGRISLEEYNILKD